MQNIGQLLDALGLQIDLEEGELINGTVVLIETISADGKPAMQVITDDNTTWIHQIGLLQAALTTTMADIGMRHNHDDDDDDDDDD